ncbi:MAG: glycosyltransferase family 39 protein [Methanoregula sp.]|nr:glycosyltransferase family 39 protein [Methanoregula sp.]
MISADIMPAAFLPASILMNHNLNFDNMASTVSEPDISYAFPLVDGHYVSRFPIVTPVLITPVYAISYMICRVFSFQIGLAGLSILAKTAAAVIAALAGVFFYQVSKEFFSKNVAVVTTCIFAFATSTWSISSLSLWQHGTVELLLILLIYLIIRNEKKESAANILLLGIISGLFIFNRPPDSVLLIPVLFYILWHQRAKLIHYAAGGMIAGLPFLYYNYSVFGNVFGGYKENIGLFVLSSDFITHFIGLLVAPNVGLLVFCPVLVLSVAGYLTLRQEKNRITRQVLLVFGPILLLQILVYSFFSQWYSSAAYCYGPRFLTGMVPVLGIYTGFFLQDWFGTPRRDHQARMKNVVLVVTGILLIVSILIQFIGVFYFLYCPDKSMSAERAWNGSDSIIIGSYSYGSGNLTGIYTYTLPPLPPLIEYRFHPASAG